MDTNDYLNIFMKAKQRNYAIGAKIRCIGRSVTNCVVNNKYPLCK